MNTLETSGIVHILLDKLEQRSSASTTSGNFSLAVFLALDFNVTTMVENPLTLIQRLANIICKGGQGRIIAAVTFANVLCRTEVHLDAPRRLFKMQPWSYFVFHARRLIYFLPTWN
jgi:hypothetical protein